MQARDPLDRHADLDGLFAQVGELGGDNGAFRELDQSDGVSARLSSGFPRALFIVLCLKSLLQ